MRGWCCQLVPWASCKSCLDVVLPYVHDRKQFGQKIGEFQVWPESLRLSTPERLKRLLDLCHLSATLRLVPLGSAHLMESTHVASICRSARLAVSTPGFAG